MKRQRETTGLKESKKHPIITKSGKVTQTKTTVKHSAAQKGTRLHITLEAKQL